MSHSLAKCNKKKNTITGLSESFPSSPVRLVLDAYACGYITSYTVSEFLSKCIFIFLDWTFLAIPATGRINQNVQFVLYATN